MFAGEGWAVCALHWARNCGQVAPPVVPAACACFHWLAQAAMTLSALAAVGPAKAAPMTSAAAAARETQDTRIADPQASGPSRAGADPT
jgi:hypothetical protein